MDWIIFAFVGIFYLTLETVESKSGLLMKNEFANLLEVDEKFIKVQNFKFYKKNRTLGALNVSYTTFIDIVSDEQVKLHVSALRFVNNEYKRTVVDFSVGICAIYKANKFNSQGIVEHSNLTGCPFPKGSYYINDISPDENMLPPFFPEGKWMIDFRFTNQGKDMAHITWLMSISKTP